MFTEIIELIVVLPLAVAFVASFLIYIYSVFAMLPYVRGGRWAKIFFLVQLPKPDGIDQYIEPNGIAHYHRLRKSGLWFMITVLCWLALRGLAAIR